MKTIFETPRKSLRNPCSPGSTLHTQDDLNRVTIENDKSDWQRLSLC